MHATNHSHTTTTNHPSHSTLTHSTLNSIILPNPLIPPTPRIPILLHKIANPTPHALFALRIFTKNRLAILYFDGRRVDIEIGHVGVDVGAVDSVVAEAERRHGRARVSKEGLCFREGFGRGSHGGRVAEEGVHVFEAHVGGFGVDEPD